MTVVKRTTSPTKVPGMSSPPSSASPELQRYLRSLQEAIEIRLGRRGDQRDRAITLRELIDSGLAEELSTRPFDPNGGGSPGFGIPGSGGQQIVETPTVPTGFSASAGYATAQLYWDFPLYRGHSLTEIWRHTTDVIGDAILVGVSADTSYIDPIGESQDYYYWIRHVNTYSEPGPFNATNGTRVQTSANVDVLLTELTGAITSSELATSLATPIGNLPTNTNSELSSLQSQIDTDVANLTTNVNNLQGQINTDVANLSTLQSQVNTDVANLQGQINTDVANLSGLQTQLNSDVANLQAQINTLSTVAAWSSSTTYSIDDLVTYNGNLYRSLTNSNTNNQPSGTTAGNTNWGFVGAYTSLSSAVGGNTADITQINFVSASSSSAAAQAIAALNSTVNDPSTGVNANSTALSGLTTRVTTAEGDISTNASDITSLTSSLSTTNSNVTGNSTAISGLDTRVTSAEGSITANSSDISSLTSSLNTTNTNLNNTNTNVTTNATAISGLDTRVTAAEGDISTNSSDITTLTSDLSTTNGNVSTNSGAITALTSRVTIAEGDISTNASDITTLNSSLTTTNGNVSTNATAISGLDTRVTTAEGDISTNSSDITALNSSLTTTNSNVSTNATAISGLDTRVTTAEGDISTNASDITSLNTSLSTTNSNVSSNASAISGLTTRVTTAEGNITSQSTDITVLTARVDAGNLADPFDDNLWYTSNSAGFATVTDGVVGTTVAKNTSTGTNQILELDRFIPLDRSKKYRIRCYARATTGTDGNLYFTLKQYLANGSSGPVNQGRNPYKIFNTGSNHISSYGAGVWHEYEGVYSPSDYQTGTTQFKPYLLLNHSSTAGSWEVQDIRVDEYTELDDLDTRITTNAASIVTESTARASADSAIASDVATLTSSLNTTDNNVSTNATAISGLDTRVTTAEGNITSNASDITSLQSSLSTTNSNVSTNATAISGLDTRVTTAEGNITSQSTALTNLTARYDVTEIQLQDVAAAMNGDTQYDYLEGSGAFDAQADVDQWDRLIGVTKTWQDSNRLRITNSLTYQGRIGINTDLLFRQGRTYRFTGTLSNANGVNNSYISLGGDTYANTGNPATRPRANSTTFGNGAFDVTITAPINSVYDDPSTEPIRLFLWNSGAGNSYISDWDDLVVTEVYDDRLSTAEADIVTEQSARASADSALASDISSLQSSLTTTNSNVSTNATAISGLDTRVTTAEGNISSNASDITSLQTSLSTTNSNVSTNATAISGLDTRVTTAEGDITSNASDITSLQTSLSTTNSNVSTNTTAISGLDTRVTTAEGDITSNASDITSLQTSLSTTNSNVSTNATAISGLDTRVTTAEGNITSNASDITSLQSSLTTTNGNVSTNATAISGLDTRVTTAEGDISSQASDITTLQTSVGSNTTSIQTNATSINGLEAQYTVKIDNNGHISGFGLASTTSGSTPTSAFIVRADNFAIISPTDTSNGLGTTTPSASIVPFTVQTTSTTLNGETVPAGVYIKDAFIKNGSIVSAKIADATIDNAKIANLDASKITTGELSTSRLNLDTNYLSQNAQGELILITSNGSNGIKVENLSDDAVGTVAFFQNTAYVSTAQQSYPTSSFLASAPYSQYTYNEPKTNIPTTITLPTIFGPSTVLASRIKESGEYIIQFGASPVGSMSNSSSTSGSFITLGIEKRVSGGSTWSPYSGTGIYDLTSNITNNGALPLVMREAQYGVNLSTGYDYRFTLRGYLRGATAVDGELGYALRYINLFRINKST